MTAAEPLLQMEDVRKSFGANRALAGVNLSLYPGEVHALIGENGAGKSTLMKIISGAIHPDSGRMQLGGGPYSPRNPRTALAAGVAMIYQELAIAPHLTVEANVMLGQEHTRGGWLASGRNRDRVTEALALLDHTGIRLDATAGRLSLGVQQLVEVARALVSDARVLVFDEPTSSLTERDSERLFQIIERLRDKGLAIVYISHFLEEVRRVAQRFTVLRDGASVGTGFIRDTPLESIIRMMVGRDPGELFPRVPHTPGDVILSLANVSGTRLPRGVDLEVRRGEVLGIAGLVGAGRTELFRAIFGLNAVRSGQVVVHGTQSPGASPRRRIQEGMGLLSEDRKREGLALGRSVADNLTYPALGRYAQWGWVNLGRRRAAANRWTSALRIKSNGVERPCATLSGGNQQKVAIARLLHQQADILLLDEPTRGIDVGSKAEIYRLIGEQAASGKAIVVASSYLPELFGICDRLAVMSRGTLSRPRPILDWTEHEVMEAATGS